MVWITKFKNDIRDFIVQEKVIEMPEVIIPSIYETQTDYQLSKEYECTLIEDTNEVTRTTTYYWFEESKQEKISPRFANKQIAEHWMRSLEQNATIKYRL